MQRPQSSYATTSSSTSNDAAGSPLTPSWSLVQRGVARQHDRDDVIEVVVFGIDESHAVRTGSSLRKDVDRARGHKDHVVQLERYAYTGTPFLVQKTS